MCGALCERPACRSLRAASALRLAPGIGPHSRATRITRAIWYFEQRHAVDVAQTLSLANFINRRLPLPTPPMPRS